MYLISQGRYLIEPKSQYNSTLLKLGSVAGPVIQANGRLEFEDGLRTGVLLHCVSR